MELLLRAEKDALTGIYNQGATEQLIRNAIDDTGDNSLSALMATSSGVSAAMSLWSI